MSLEADAKASDMPDPAVGTGVGAGATAEQYSCWLQSLRQVSGSRSSRASVPDRIGLCDSRAPLLLLVLRLVASLLPELQALLPERAASISQCVVSVNAVRDLESSRGGVLFRCRCR